MTDETKTAEATKTVDDIKSRMVFDSPAAALSYIGEISDYEGFGDLQQAIVGLLVDDDGNPVVDDEGNPQLDPAIYDSTMQVAVAVLSEKDTGAKKLVPVGLAVYQTPAPEAVAATEEGAKWIAKLAEKESNLIRSEEHTSELQALMRISYAVFSLKKKQSTQKKNKVHKQMNNTNTEQE